MGTTRTESVMDGIDLEVETNGTQTHYRLAGVEIAHFDANLQTLTLFDVTSERVATNAVASQIALTSLSIIMAGL